MEVSLHMYAWLIVTLKAVLLTADFCHDEKEEGPGPRLKLSHVS